MGNAASTSANEVFEKAERYLLLLKKEAALAAPTRQTILRYSDTVRGLLQQLAGSSFDRMCRDKEREVAAIERANGGPATDDDYFTLAKERLAEAQRLADTGDRAALGKVEQARDVLDRMGGGFMDERRMLMKQLHEVEVKLKP